MNIDNNKSNISNKNRISIYNIFGIEENDEVESYIKINTKNQFDIYNSNESEKKLNEIIKYVDELVNEESSVENVSQIFLERLFPNCQKKAFLISRNISKRIMKSKKMNRATIEEKIKYFFEKRVDLRYSKKLILDKDSINNLGYILSYSYSKFEEFKIFSKRNLNNYVQMSKKIDAINDFYANCNETGKSPLDNSILDFLESKSSVYLLPGEFIFLINIFEFIQILEIDMDLDIDKLKEYHKEDFYLFIITLLNIHYLAVLTNHFKVNFINMQFQKDIYTFSTDEIKSLYKHYNRYIKKNKEISENKLYEKKWDFENIYIIKNNKKLFTNKEDESIIKKENNINNNISFNPNFNTKNENESLSKNMTFVEISKDGDFFFSNIIDKAKRSGSLFIKPKILLGAGVLRANTEEFSEFGDFGEIDEKFVKKIKNKYDNLIDRNKIMIELIYIVCLSVLRLNNLKNLDLIMNDCYFNEFINYFENYYSSFKLSSGIKNFHLLNHFIKKMQKLQLFNIEFNSLDYLTFYKLLSLLKNNENLNSLQISFFSSSITYSPQFIYKLYRQNNDKKEINNIGFNNIESYLLNELLLFFIENLEVLFELIKMKREKLEILSFNFDIPEIIAVNQRYLNGILKFILNILFLADNTNSKLKKLVILSSRTILDSRSIQNIEDIIDTINIDKKNENIKELSIQLQFYEINNIKNLISHNLTKLNIGDLDIYTLGKLAKHLCSYTFFKKSCLISLKIGILNCYTKYNKEIEYILNELFAIKIKTLKEINIYSNILINRRNKFYKILENNWISSCVLTLNEKSELSWKQREIEENIEKIMKENKNKIIKKNQEQKVLYLLHHELEDEILTANERALRKKKNLKKTDCEIAWYLRYKFIFELSKKKGFKFNYYELKNIIFNILKYLYFTKTTKIQNDI